MVTMGNFLFFSTHISNRSAINQLRYPLFAERWRRQRCASWYQCVCAETVDGITASVRKMTPIALFDFHIEIKSIWINRFFARLLFIWNSSKCLATSFAHSLTHSLADWIVTINGTLITVNTHTHTHTRQLSRHIRVHTTSAAHFPIRTTHVRCQPHTKSSFAKRTP